MRSSLVLYSQRRIICNLCVRGRLTCGIGSHAVTHLATIRAIESIKRGSAHGLVGIGPDSLQRTLLIERIAWGVSPTEMKYWEVVARKTGRTLLRIYITVNIGITDMRVMSMLTISLLIQHQLDVRLFPVRPSALFWSNYIRWGWPPSVKFPPIWIIFPMKCQTLVMKPATLKTVNRGWKMNTTRSVDPSSCGILP